jgi:hypothetical protein
LRDCYSVARVRWQLIADGLTAIEGRGVDHGFLDFTAPSGDGDQLFNRQLETMAQLRSLVPGTPT